MKEKEGQMRGALQARKEWVMTKMKSSHVDEGI